MHIFAGLCYVVKMELEGQIIAIAAINAQHTAEMNPFEHYNIRTPP